MNTANPIIQGQINARDPAAAPWSAISRPSSTSRQRVRDRRDADWQRADGDLSGSATAARTSARAGSSSRWASAHPMVRFQQQPALGCAIGRAITEQSSAPRDIHVHLTDDEGKVVVAIQSSAATLYLSDNLALTDRQKGRAGVGMSTPIDSSMDQTPLPGREDLCDT